MKFPGTNGGGGTGTAEQTLEETQRWAKLVRWFEKNGGRDVPLDFRMRVASVKREHEVMGYDEVSKTRVLQYWGKDTPLEKRVVMRKKKDGTEYEGKMTEGCQIILEMVDPKYAGLRHELECAFSDFHNSALVKLVSAAFRGKVGEDDDVDPVEDLPNKEVMVAISMGTARTATCVDGSPVKGGYWWNVKGSTFKPVPVEDDDEDDWVDDATDPQGAMAQVMGHKRTKPAPVKRGGTATMERPAADDDDEPPF